MIMKTAAHKKINRRNFFGQIHWNTNSLEGHDILHCRKGRKCNVIKDNLTKNFMVLKNIKKNSF